MVFVFTLGSFLMMKSASIHHLSIKKTSWNNRLFRTPALDCVTGDELTLTIDMPSTLVADTWQVTVQKYPEQIEKNIPVTEPV